MQFTHLSGAGFAEYWLLSRGYKEFVTKDDSINHCSVKKKKKEEGYEVNIEAFDITWQVRKLES